jgi:hypothetical protein
MDSILERASRAPQSIAHRYLSHAQLCRKLNEIEGKQNRDRLHVSYF